MNKREYPFSTFFFRFFWTILVLIFCYGFYLHAMHKKKVLFTLLKKKHVFLEKELAYSLEKREDLLLQIESQKDPTWVEMLIKKHLGMVPFGQTKVYFTKKE